MTDERQRGVPRLPEALVRRPRLNALLDDAGSIVIVRALRGWGKTTLVADWLRGLDQDTTTSVWIDVTADLSDRSQFTRYLRRRMQGAGLTIAPATGDSSPSMIELHEALFALDHGRAAVFVLDGLDNLTDGSLVSDLISLVSKHHNLRLVACTRVPHPIEPLASIVSSSRLIQTRDLRFTPDEAEELAVTMRIPITPARFTWGPEVGHLT